MKLYSKTIHGHKRRVGVWENGIAYLPVYSAHFFQKAGAWGIDEDVVQTLETIGCKKIVLEVRETGEKLWADFKEFLLHSWIHDFENFVPKRFLALDRWQKVPPKSREEEMKEMLIAAGAF